jgi:hypothetical protein
MRNKEEDLLNEIHEMRNLMEYMDSNIITENTVSTGDIKKTFKTQSRDNLGGLENAREKEVVDALQQLIEKFKKEGNQYNQNVKIFIEKLWNAVNGAGEVNEGLITKDLTDEMISKYNIDALVNKIIAQEKGKFHASNIPSLFASIGERFRFRKKNKNK